MTRFHFLAAPILICAASSPARAETDFQQWISLSAKVDLSESLSLQDEIVARFSDNRDGLYEIENSLLLGYKVADGVTAAAGYVHNPTYAADDFVVMERRAREQVSIDNFAKIGAASLSARMRLEQRWRDGVDGTAWRARPYAKLAVPLGGKTAPTLNLTAETFVNLNTTSFQSTSGLERLRSAVSLSFPLGKSIKLDAGYLNQHRFVRGGEDTGDHAITASLGFSF